MSHWRVHAAAVEGARGAVLIAGASGSGKTTLAAALVGRGLALVADEAGIVDHDWNIEPAATWLALRTPALRLLDRCLPGDTLPTCLRADGSTAHLLVPARRVRCRVRASALLFPRQGHDADAGLVPLGVPAAVMRLAEAGIELPNRLNRSDADMLLNGLRMLPCYEVRMGTIDNAAEGVVRLLA
ncbi:MAG: hypothetical protein QM736_18850 [Vicinamibacterales bacterium]